jgi:hypothetical protein
LDRAGRKVFSFVAFFAFKVVRLLGKTLAFLEATQRQAIRIMFGKVPLELLVFTSSIQCSVLYFTWSWLLFGMLSIIKSVSSRWKKPSIAFKHCGSWKPLPSWVVNLIFYSENVPVEFSISGFCNFLLITFHTNWLKCQIDFIVSASTFFLYFLPTRLNIDLERCGVENFNVIVCAILKAIKWSEGCN